MLEALTHGWSGIAFAYGTVQAPMLYAAIRAKAPLRRLLGCPLLALPTMVAAGITNAATSAMLRSWGAVSGGLLELSTGVGVCVGLGYVCGRLLARRTSDTTYRRGALVVQAEASESARRAPARGASRDADITVAGLKVPFADETKHFKFIGTTGTGKSTAICEVLESALVRGDRAVIADPDGGYLRRFYNPRRGDLILNPFDSRSAKWDLYGEIANDYDIEQLARSLIPDQDGGERSWRAYARTFLSAIVRQTRDGDIKDVKQLYQVLVMAPTKELKVLVAGTPAQPFLEQNNSRMFDSIRSVTSSAVGALAYIGEQRGSPLAVRDWVNRGRGSLFIPYRAGQIAALRSTISAWLRLAIFETMNRPEGDRRIWFVVDELDALGQIDGLKDALARLRKFGGRCVLGLQSIAQVSGTYGEAEARTIVENCGNTLILRCSASERGGTSGFASQLIGKREVLQSTESRSRRAFQLRPVVTRSQHIALESAVLDSEIEQLPDLQGYLKFASSAQWRRVRLSPLSTSRAAEPAPKASHEAGVMSERDKDSSAQFEP